MNHKYHPVEYLATDRSTDREARRWLSQLFGISGKLFSKPSYLRSFLVLNLAVLVLFWSQAQRS